jgi:hypothetical protein
MPTKEELLNELTMEPHGQSPWSSAQADKTTQAITLKRTE